MTEPRSLTLPPSSQRTGKPRTQLQPGLACAGHRGSVTIAANETTADFNDLL